VCHFKFQTMINTIVGARSIGAGAASRYGFGYSSDQMMRLLAAPAPQHWLQRYDFLNRGTLEVKPVSLICKCCHKLPPPKNFAKNKLNHGTFPLTVESLTIQTKKQYLKIYKRCVLQLRLILFYCICLQ
jgi:hypothetical protein